MKEFFLVGLGGAIGSMLRYTSTLLFTARLSPSLFPYATFAVNIAGCLIIGLVLGLSQHHAWLNPQLRLLLATGLCGGFTTFSAFAYENVQLINQQNYFLAFVYILLCVVLCLIATGFGVWISKFFVS